MTTSLFKVGSMVEVREDFRNFGVNYGVGIVVGVLDYTDRKKYPNHEDAVYYKIHWLGGADPTFWEHPELVPFEGE